MSSNVMLASPLLCQRNATSIRDATSSMRAHCPDVYVSLTDQTKLKRNATQRSMSAHTFPPEGPISSGGS